MPNSILRPALLAAGLWLAAGAAPALAATPAATAPALAVATAPAKGVLRVRSRYPFDATVSRIKADIAAKGIKFFAEIDQGQLAAGADIKLPPSTLLIFGNPPLGVQFLTANPLAGLDWPVRMQVVQDADGSVWVAWTDFAFIGERYAINDRAPAIKMASEVSASIASSVTREN